MERAEAFIKEYIPEAVTWEIPRCTKVIINNPNDDCLNGTYEFFHTLYEDK